MFLSCTSNSWTLILGDVVGKVRDSVTSGFIDRDDEFMWSEA